MGKKNFPFLLVLYLPGHRVGDWETILADRGTVSGELKQTGVSVCLFALDSGLGSLGSCRIRTRVRFLAPETQNGGCPGSFILST